jgi:hypothetical protein
MRSISRSSRRPSGVLTTVNGLTGWWTTKAEGDPTRGGVINFTFSDDFNPDMRVDVIESGLVEWTCVGGHEPWAGNRFRFEFTGSSPVSFEMRQEYARELDDRVYGFYNFNWGYYLDSLRLLVETGTGKPFQVDAAGLQAGARS